MKSEHPCLAVVRSLCSLAVFVFFLQSLHAQPVVAGFDDSAVVACRQALALEHSWLAALFNCHTEQEFFSQLKKVPATSVCWRILPFWHPLNRHSLRYSSKFGYRVHPVTGRWTLHRGLDIVAASGTPVYSAGAGRIIRTGVDKYLGNFVKIDHGFGWSSVYGHLSFAAAQAGSFVSAGTFIGRSGSTGRSTGPHLHFGMYFHRKPVDGMKYLTLLESVVAAN